MTQTGIETFTMRLDAMIDRALSGDQRRDASVDDRAFEAAHFIAGTAADLLPSASVRERVWQRTQARMSTRGARWPLASLVTPSRFGAMPITLFLMLGVLVGAAYAIPLIPSIFGVIEPSAVAILQSDRGQALNLSQTVAGVTITADHVYVDSRQVIVKFTVQNPPADPGQPFNQGQQVAAPLPTGGLSLTDEQGRSYRLLHGAESPVMQGTVWKGEPLAAIYTFDASHIPADAASVTLRLSIAELRGVPGSGGVRYGVTGPWTFTFVAPVSRYL
jgi:hypothetical protein